MPNEFPPLVTAADLEPYDIDTSNEALINSLIAAVSSGIREAAGVPISKVQSTVELYGRNSQFLEIPGGPLLSVDEVLSEGEPVTDYKIRDGRLWRKASWGTIEDDITVTFTHGWDPVPADVVKLGINLVAAGLNEATSEGGLASRRGLVSKQMSLDDYSEQESYVRGEDEVIDLTEIPDRTREWLRRRFSSQAFVTGGQ
ncbi:hypothetical protein [Nesterenkonia haasae]|uniref:hypothetical protein n=1 Tax=Nesterenkonia haasae TaxID=2587813 RepID=UPI001390E864|nr:hypothetical protein [Nesterenkonia haasae]NDK31185.1 hypothetical protein [Nesterenkonia haasae]